MFSESQPACSGLRHKTNAVVPARKVCDSALIEVIRHDVATAGENIRWAKINEVVREIAGRLHDIRPPAGGEPRDADIAALPVHGQNAKAGHLIRDATDGQHPAGMREEGTGIRHDE